jgi:hypothetical protein
VGHAGPIDPIVRQLRAVRWRNNLHLVQHAAAVWVGASAGAAACVVLAAIRAGRAGFVLVTIAAGVGVATVSALLARRVARGWLGTTTVPAHIDAARALHGRVRSATELAGRAPGTLFPLLLRQNLDALPRWRPDEVVPEVVPARAIAGALAAISLLALVVVLAPTLRIPPPRIVVGDRRLDFVRSDQSRDGAERLLVTPGAEQSLPESDADATAPEADRESDLPGDLADASGALQDWLREALGVEERWEAGEPVPESARAARPARAGRTISGDSRPAARPVAGGHDVPGRSEAGEADGAAARKAGSEAGAPGGEGGTGAGGDTDPALYGAPRDPGGASSDRFELAIAARVRTSRGAAMSPWTRAPEAGGDRRPVLSREQRTEQPGHRMPIPSAFAPAVRRLYAHPAEGAPR